MLISIKVILLITLLLSACASPFKQSAGEKHKPVKLELRLAEREPGEGLSEAMIQNGDEKIYLHKEAIITNADIIEARAVEGYAGANYDIQIEFTEEGARRMEKITEENIGKQIAILFDGQVISAPSVQSKISDKAVITGNFTKEEAEGLAYGIRSK
ncbi:MAG: hypothetical protein L0229_26005 [Blastocatellia bacterium]|nr:hypothetical protein [Blastocatellia bacterium]